ncbi:MAG TPA: twin transmembrane helix small protein [Steroidobacteraceae bacterium]|nr:twin transmembrane helix small protein [Steroidobacteraceae bacterium]
MASLIRLLVVVGLLVVVASLGNALYHLARGPGRGDSRKLLRALTFRIGLSVVVFILLMAAWYAGLIAPHGVEPR